MFGLHFAHFSVHFFAQFNELEVRLREDELIRSQILRRSQQGCYHSIFDLIRIFFGRRKINLDQCLYWFQLYDINSGSIMNDNNSI